VITRSALAAGLTLAALLATGCGPSNSGSPQDVPSSATGTSTTSVKAAPAPVPARTPSAAPASGPENNPCAQAQFAPTQFTGDWTEQGGSGVTTLGADGTLTIHDGNSVDTGTWSYTPWEFTSAADQMPPSAANQCVLWLRISTPPPNSNLVYVPLKVTADSLELSYVGRGNTLVWTRAAAGS
jgi:hypothetical protein